ncbi:hypothetical protein [uncultured Helicobacter sp.]|uniref:hypothetical protein n=1 Tax=uncultured Helicobacter sp. TaxID=175537 RepID=UPI002609CBC9|nr:hypothetical protein [uncultured Helicobacter sp.]
MDLSYLSPRNSSEENVFLEGLVEIEEVGATTNIKHYDRQRSVMIYANLFLIYFILVSLIPLATIGHYDDFTLKLYRGILALFISGKSLSLFSTMGLMLLMGLVGKMRL